MNTKIGSVIVFSLCAAVYIYAQNVLTIESTTAFSGDNGVEVRILLDNDINVDAVSFAAQFPSELMYSTPDNAAAVAGTLFGPENLDAEWVYQGFQDNGTTRFFYMSAVIDIFEPFEERVLSPATSQHIFSVYFDVADGLALGQELLIDLRDDLGDPIIRPVITTRGVSTVLDLVDGHITIMVSPSVNSISPQVGPIAGGTAITITGPDFTDDVEVSLGGQLLSPVIFVDSTTITAITPAGTSGTVDLKISNSYGEDTLTDAFTYVAPPEISSIEPAIGNGNMEITISGLNFSTLADTIVTFGGVEVGEMTEVTPTTITCTIPTCDTLNIWVEISVTTTGGTATMQDGYYCTTTFRRGDANCDSFLDVSDAIVILNYLFIHNSSGQTPQCTDSVDVNDDSYIDISDCVSLLYYLFGVMGPPPAPFGQLGVDPTEDSIGCNSQCGI